MKNITELTEQEILQLSEDDLQKMVKLEMAEQGVKILERPQFPDYKPELEKTETAYKVKGFEGLVTSSDTAELLSDFIQKHKSVFVNYTFAGSVKHLKPYDKYQQDQIGNIEREAYYASNVSKEIKEIEDYNRILKDEYLLELSDYNDVQEKVSAIEDVIYNRFREVNKKYYDMNLMKSRYEEYLSLADGNSEIALTFLKKAWSVDAETEAYITSSEGVDALKPTNVPKSTPVFTEDESSENDLPTFF